MIKKPKHWAADAQHIAALMANAWGQPDLLTIVIHTRDDLLAHLESVEEELPLIDHGGIYSERFINPPGDATRPDLKNPDFGVPYYLYFRGLYKGRNLAALELFLRCLHIIERGSLSEADKIFFPSEYLKMAGIEAESRQRAGRVPGPRKRSALQVDLIDLQRTHPEETLDALLTKLEGDGRVTEWHTSEVEGGVIFWLDDKGEEQQTPRGTVKRWFTKARQIRS